MNLWFEKYRPKSLDDLVISDIKKESLTDWFTRFQIGETAECALLFTGPPGLGKTSLAHVLMDTFGYKAKEFNASDIRSKALVKDNLYGLINIADVTSVTNRNNRPVGIIMDEVDGMFKGDRGGIEELLSYISIPSNRKKKVTKNFNRQVPIICICNIGNVKKEVIKNLKKECFEVSFSLPDNRSLRKVADRIIRGEQMSITEEAIESIISHSQGDYRRLISIMEFLFVTNGPNIQQDQVEKCYAVFSKKEQDLHITDSIKRLINNMLDGHSTHTIYDGDKSKAPMVVHQNYLQAISLQKTHPMTKINNAIDCMDSLIVSDIIEKTMYNTQCWYLQPIQGYTCALIPNYYINKHPKSSYVTASWASVLSVSSQSQNLRKNMYNEIYNVDLEHSYSIEDIQVIVETVFHYLIQGETTRAIKMLLDYNLTELNECISPTCRKKTLLIIDKIAKYIKISRYYTKWIKFRDSNKGNKELDQTIKDCVQEHSRDTRVVKSTKSSSPFHSSIKTRLRTAPTPAPAPAPAPSGGGGAAPKRPKLKPVVKSRQEQITLASKRRIVTIKREPAQPRPPP
jgi:replication factor C subunit 1